MLGPPGLHHRWRWQPTWFLEITPIAMTGGDRALAGQLAQEASQLAGRNPSVLTNAGVALLVRGLVRDDRPGIERGAEVLREAPRPSVRASAALELGQKLLRDGHRVRAGRALDEAWEIFTGMGAHGRAAAAQRLLRSSGAGQRRGERVTVRPSRGWESLTPAEQRVARLIADGHTNRSAAAELVVSVNTVATHVRAIFRKLDVKSRVQLAIAVRELPEPRTGG
jgi:DNA-binding CsgD family transcriptional regulator